MLGQKSIYLAKKGGADGAFRRFSAAIPLPSRLLGKTKR
jgi:hypothetical protein